MKNTTHTLNDIKARVRQKQEHLKKNDKGDFNKQARMNKSHAGPLLQIFSGMLVGSYLGYNLDSYLETQPAFFFLFTIFGVAGGIYNCYNPFHPRKNSYIKSQKNE